MTHPISTDCDDALLDRYREATLDDEERARFKAHLQGCPQCRGQVAAMTAFSRGFRARVQQVTDSVDFVALEKQVLIKALRQRYPRSGFATLLAFLRFAIPLAVTAGLLVFFAYSTYVAKPAPLPSAIINSFTGSVSSVMIFETPESRQTILWYKEDTGKESEHDAM